MEDLTSFTILQNPRDSRRQFGVYRNPPGTADPLVLVGDAFVTQPRITADSGLRIIGLGAHGFDTRPSYNKSTAGKLRKVGMDILVCTPEKLAECMAEIIRG
jgi:hypothetical protein